MLMNLRAQGPGLRAQKVKSRFYALDDRTCLGLAPNWALGPESWALKPAEAICPISLTRPFATKRVLVDG